jgi:hypothetical protein
VERFWQKNAKNLVDMLFINKKLKIDFWDKKLRRRDCSFDSIEILSHLRPVLSKN